MQISIWGYIFFIHVTQCQNETTNVKATLCTCDVTLDFCDCCCDADCTVEERALLDCQTTIFTKLPIGWNDDNSFYLGEYYDAGDFSEDQINEIFNKHVTNEGSKSCGGGNLYCPGDEILISPNQAFNVFSNGFGQCIERGLKIQENSAVVCASSTTGCVALADLSGLSICSSPSCDSSLAATIFRNSKSTPESVDVNDVGSLETTCIASIWYEIGLNQTQTGFQIATFNIFTDFGAGSTDPIDLSVDVSYFGPSELKYRDNGGYALGEPIAIESGSPDFSDCNVKNYELKMGYDAAFTCFSSYAFSSNDCEARRNAIITELNSTLFSNVRWNTTSSGDSDNEMPIVISELPPIEEDPVGGCRLPSHARHQFVYQKFESIYRLEGLSVSYDYSNIRLSSPYSLKMSVSFVERISSSKMKWENPFSCTNSELCNTRVRLQGFEPLFLIILATLYVLSVYIYIARNPGSNFKYKIS